MSEFAHQWVERAFKLVLDDFQRRAVDLLCRSQGCGPYDLSRTFEVADWHHGKGVRFVLFRPRLATTDGNGLTKLVIGAHEEMIRVEIEPVNFRNLAICMWPRVSRVGNLGQTHPTIEQAVEDFRGKRRSSTNPHEGEVVVTWDHPRTRILAVTRQDEEGRILKIIAEAPNP